MGGAGQVGGEEEVVFSSHNYGGDGQGEDGGYQEGVEEGGDVVGGVWGERSVQWGCKRLAEDRTTG